MTDNQLMERAIVLATENVSKGGWPFSAIIERGGDIIAEGVNSVHISHDPSDHAEIAAIRRATSALCTPDLSGCSMFVLGVPCPMCLACIILAKVGRIVYAVDIDRKDACLTKLPLSTKLYELVSNDFGASVIKYRHLPHFSPQGEALFESWNSQLGG